MASKNRIMIFEEKSGKDRTYLDLQSFLDTLPFYVMLIDDKHNILQVNKAVEQALGVSADTIIEKYCPEAIHGLDGPFPGNPLEELVKNKNARFVACQIFNEKRCCWFRPVIYRTEFKTSDGRSVFIEITYDITEKKQTEVKLQESLKKLEKTVIYTVEAIARIIDLKDPYTAGHQQRVASLSMAIAEELGFSKDMIKGIHYAGIIHDIGKIFIPSEILNKPGRLAEHEFALIKTHPTGGYEILKNMDLPWAVADVVYQHHERLDGSGYPRGLTEDNILLEAKILAVADVVEAMASHRPYRPARGIGIALEEILRGRGKLYDPRVVDISIKLFSEKGFQFPVKDEE